MCGRNSLFLDQATLEERFDAMVAPDVDYQPRYNIAPGADHEVITNEDPNTITQHHWGLIPFWADEPEEGIINARAETVAEKDVFDRAWESRPCLVPSTGFYEWRDPNGGHKTPYRVYREDDEAFAMAGIWDVWEGEETEIATVTILTTEPNEVVRPIHDRMPVVLPRAEEETWLQSGPERRAELCRPYADGDLDAYEISTQVNDPTNDFAGVIEPIGHEQSGIGEFGSD